MNSLIPGADILEDFHFIPDSKSTTLVYKFGSSTEHSPYDEGLTTMGAGTAIYYFTATGTLGTIYAFAAGDQKAFLKKYNNGTWSNWMALVSNADISYGNLGTGDFGAVEGRWQKFGQIVTFAGLIRSISGASGNWGTLATTPYTALSSIWFRPLLNTTGNEPVVRDGNINGSNIESWLNSEDNGKYIFFSGTYVCNN